MRRTWHNKPLFHTESIRLNHIHGKRKLQNRKRKLKARFGQPWATECQLTWKCFRDGWKMESKAVGVIDKWLHLHKFLNPSWILIWAWGISSVKSHINGQRWLKGKIFSLNSMTVILIILLTVHWQSRAGYQTLVWDGKIPKELALSELVLWFVTITKS